MNEEKEKIMNLEIFYNTAIKGIKKKLKLLTDTLITHFRDELYTYNSEFKTIHLVAIKGIIESLQKLKEYIEKGEYKCFCPY